MIVRQGPFTKVRQRVSLAITIRQRFVNVLVREKQFAKDSLTSQFTKNHSPKIRQLFSSPRTIRQKIRQRVSSPKTIRQTFVNLLVHLGPFAKDSQTSQFARNHSPKNHQRVSSPKTFRQRFPNVSVRQKPFNKDSPV